jgi:hypothetical protein
LVSKTGVFYHLKLHFTSQAGPAWLTEKLVKCSNPKFIIILNLSAFLRLSGYLEDAPMRMWSQFAVRQKQRYVPIPPDANRRTLPETKGIASPPNF